ncbi:MAG: universal stress protein [Desulfatiglandaceae bacterium]|jgi:nucleotide-binding universal stress UspA family protein/CheY-like chemotaxis protein
MANKILVPVDGSQDAFNAIRFAANAARQSGAEVHLLHVVKKARIPEELGEYIRVEQIKEPPLEVYINLMGNHIMAGAQTEAKEHGVKPVETAILLGDPADVIVEYAKACHVNMIVMGSQGLGNVSGRVCRSATHQTCVIVRRNLLDGKRILIVDDEPDILETLEELLPMCEVAKASSSGEAKDLLEGQSFDMAILDIMGVNGFELLKLAKARNILAVMLTAHALSPETTAQAYKEGAASYVPKEKLRNIAVYLNDVLEAVEKGKNSWWRWFERFGALYEKQFGATLKKSRQ